MDAFDVRIHTIRRRKGRRSPFEVCWQAAGRSRSKRPEEAVALRQADLVLPAHRRGKLVLTGACPRTGSAWTSTGNPYELRGLKHRPDGTVRVVPVPSALAGLLRQHLREYGTAPDGRLFRGARRRHAQ